MMTVRYHSCVDPDGSVEETISQHLVKCAADMHILVRMVCSVVPDSICRAAAWYTTRGGGGGGGSAGAPAGLGVLGCLRSLGLP